MSEQETESPDGYAEPLASRNFRPVDTALPGDWASNVELTVQITRRRTISDTELCVVRVYDAPVDALEIPRVDLVGKSEDEDNVTALRLALSGAERKLKARLLEDVRHEITERPVDDLSGPALHAEWSEAYESLHVGGLDDDERELLRDRRRALWKEMENRTDADPPACPDCGHRGWTQAPTGGPKECVGCGYALSAEEMDLIEAIDEYWVAVRAQGGSEDE